MDHSQFNVDEVVQLLVENGYNTPDAVLGFMEILVLAATTYQLSALGTTGPAVELPAGQRYSSADLKRAGYPDCPTSKGSLYAVIDSGRGSELSQADLEGIGLEPFQVRFLLAAIETNSAVPLSWE